MGWKVNICLNVFVSVSYKGRVWKIKYSLILNKPFYPHICCWREILSDDSHRSRGNRGFTVKKVTSWSLFCAAGQTPLWFRGNCHCLSLGQLFFLTTMSSLLIKTNSIARQSMKQRCNCWGASMLSGEKEWRVVVRRDVVKIKWNEFSCLPDLANNS